MRPSARAVLEDAYLQWAQVADETRDFRDFSAYAIHRLKVWGYAIS